MIAAALLAVASLLAPPPPPPAPALARRADEVHDRSDALLAEKRYEEAAALLREHLMRAGDDAGAHERLGRALLALDRPDQAAHPCRPARRLDARP